MFTINMRPGSSLLALLAATCMACGPEADDPGFRYAFEVPAEFPPATYSFQNNPLTTDGFELGRMLFYDPILSSDSTVSCSTCHRQQTGFADPTHRVNHGVNNQFGKRNSPALANMAFMNDFFFDGGVNHLDFVPINAITSPVEMGSTLKDVMKRLNRNARYQAKFRGAFGVAEAESQHMLHALSQFTVMLISANADYDKVQRGTQTFTTEQAEGHTLFQQKCASCHATPLFTDGSFRNNGLDADFTKDTGREVITESEADRGKFKVPSLRNIELTPPYMHDGRFKTLDDVLDHYRGGVKNSPTLDPVLTHNDGYGISITDDEKQKLLAFLYTLTDTDFITDKRFADPF